jgi:hypothetical protein
MPRVGQVFIVLIALVCLYWSRRVQTAEILKSTCKLTRGRSTDTTARSIAAVTRQGSIGQKNTGLVTGTIATRLGSIRIRPPSRKDAMLTLMATRNQTIPMGRFHWVMTTMSSNVTPVLAAHFMK